MPAAARTRMSAEARRELVLAAAVAAFAEGGYTGTTTDQVARRAGVSQPYVVRMFGTKQALFLAAHAQVMTALAETFTQAVPSAGEDAVAALGDAYVRLIEDRDLLRVLQHGFALGADPELGPPMRAAMIRIFALIRDLTGVDADQARDFLAQGMLINTLVALHMPEHLDEDPLIPELVKCVLVDGLGRREA